MAIHKVILTEEEAKKFSEENKLKPEELEAINGGYLHWERGLGYEIIDDINGKKIDGYYSGLEYAQSMARDAGVSTKEITDDQLNLLRKCRGLVRFD